MPTLIFTDRDTALHEGRIQARNLATVHVLVQDEKDGAWVTMEYTNFIPQSDGYVGESLRYILPRGECCKLS